MALPNSGTCSYQVGTSTVTFASLYKSKVSMQPVKDSAARALVGRKYVLEVEGYVTAAAGQTTDAALTTMRQTLARPAGILTYQSKGVGPLVVNKPGGKIFDIEYGPWTELLDWEPRGNDVGAKVKWKVTTVLHCEELPQPQGGIVESCYEVDWDIDDKGLTKRTVSGHLVIAATRTSATSQAVPANADDHYEKVVPELPKGYRRTAHRKLSEDKRRLDYTVTDEEIPFALPDGIVEAEVTQRIAFRGMKKGMQGLVGNLSGRLTVAAGSDKTLIWDKILLLIDARLSRQRAKAGLKQTLVSIKAVDLPKDNRGMTILTAVELEDEVFGLTTSFRVEYIVCGAFLPSLLVASGMWEKVPGTSFETWKTSMLAGAFAARGVNGMYFKNNADVIMDLCGPQKPGKDLVSGKMPQPPKRGRIVKEEAGPVDPQRSWLYYENRLRLLVDNRIAVHKPLKQKAPPKAVEPLVPGVARAAPDGGAPRILTTVSPSGATSGGATIEFADPPGTRKKEGPPGPNTTSTTPDQTQQVSSPSYTIVMVGEALTLGYRIPAPALVSVGGVKVVQMSAAVDEERVSQVGGISVWRTSWRIWYRLPMYTPGTVLPVPANPALDRAD